MFRNLFSEPQGSPLIEGAFRDVAEMLTQAERMLDHALGAVLDNRALEVDLERMDDSVDEGERMVRRSVLEHLTVNPKQDLVASLVLASMVQDAERIGDFARSISELVRLAASPREGAFRDELHALAGEIRPLFKLCREAFDEDDPESARQVIAAHVSIKARLKEVIARVAASDLGADMAVVYSALARSLSRVSAHLSNIASSVVQPYDRIRHGDEEA